MSRDLVIIESPGKLKTLHRVFSEIGLQADVCATIGHFLDNPASLRDLAIEIRDDEFVETKRRPFREDSYRYLCDQIRRCSGRILIATDNDQEGHVIAQDVVDLARELAPSRPALRMLMSGLDRQSVSAALSNLQPVSSAKATPGTARRIADRIIGAGMSDFERNLPVGRVQSALLGLCATGLAHSKVNLRMPCSDGGKPFVGEFPVCGATTPAKLIAELGAFDLPPAPVARSEGRAAALPLSYGDALLGLNRTLEMKIEEAADLLQRMYEAGDISYPRTSSRGMTEAGRESAARLARAKGLLAFKRDLLPHTDFASPHEALRVLNEGRLRSLDIGKPLKLHDMDRDAVLAFIARRTLESGIPARRDYPDLSHAPEWARDIAWVRDTRGAVLPWRYPDPPQSVGRDVKAALVEAMMDAGIGRPSTYAQHAMRFAERRLVDYKNELTSKGRDWLDFAPQSLVRAETSVRIESLLDQEDRPVADLVAGALELAAGDDAAALETLYAQLQDVADLAEDADEADLRYRPAF